MSSLSRLVSTSQKVGQNLSGRSLFTKPYAARSVGIRRYASQSQGAQAQQAQTQAESKGQTSEKQITETEKRGGRQRERAVSPFEDMDLFSPFGIFEPRSPLTASFDQLRKMMLRDFDEVFNRTLGTSPSMQAVFDWSPRADVEQLPDGGLKIAAELPGVDKNNLKVEVKDNVLTIRGEKKIQKEEKEGNIVRKERGEGVFIRRFALPEGIEAKDIKSNYKDGILTIQIPAPPASQKAHQVNVE